jgi:hypothetical protein
MAKENVSARVPPKIADGIDEYAEVWDLNRTEAMTLILRNGLENPPRPRHIRDGGEIDPLKGTYTIALEPEEAERVQEVMEENDEDIQDIINRLISVYF